MIRKAIFWAHLSCGLAAGLIVVDMSVTGLLLAFERQILAYADRAAEPSHPADAKPKPLGELAAMVDKGGNGSVPTTFTIPRDSTAPISVGSFRAGMHYIDRYTGQALPPASAGLRNFFRTVENFHRWFNVRGASRNTARAIADAGNLVFLALVLSGFYLWLPPVFRWAGFKTRLLFNSKVKSSKARDFNWHHVFGIWSAIPLAVVVGAGVIMSYGWANNLLYRVVGDTPPSFGGFGAERGGFGGERGGFGAERGEFRGGPRGGGEGFEGGRGRFRPPFGRGAAAGPGTDSPPQQQTGTPLGIEALVEHAAAVAPHWRSMSLSLPRPGARSVSVQIDTGTGGQPQRRSRLVLDAYNGAVLSSSSFADQTRGQRARSLARFLHTGEALGTVGQTIAALATAGSLFMVWTGWSLAYRRLIKPLFKRRSTKASQAS